MVVTIHIREALSDEKYRKRAPVSLIQIMEQVKLENELQGVSAYTDMAHPKQKSTSAVTYLVRVVLHRYVHCHLNGFSLPPKLSIGGL